MKVGEAVQILSLLIISALAKTNIRCKTNNVAQD
jgi:hypothetical protein